MDFKVRYYPQDIAETLINIYRNNDDSISTEFIEEDVIKSIYDIKAICENEYNAEYWRVLYRLLEGITYTYETGKRG